MQKISIPLLGIDNVFFEVDDLDQAIAFYQLLGLKLKFKKDDILALFQIGNEEPGLILRKTNMPKLSRLWIEVKDALLMKTKCEKLNISGSVIETATGITFEITDNSGNIIGFADYRKQPTLARKNIEK